MPAPHATARRAAAVVVGGLVGLRLLRTLALRVPHATPADGSQLRSLHAGMLAGPLMSPAALIYSRAAGSLLPSAPELDLSPDLDANCYGYATDERRDQRPGHFALRRHDPGAQRFFANDPDTTTIRALRRALLLDDACPVRPWHLLRPRQGVTAAAVFLSPGQDWHFVRLNAGGSWSHKPGSQEPRVDGLPGCPWTGPVRVAGHHRYLFVGLYLFPIRG